MPSRCVCDPAGCLRKVCQPGYLNILVSKASGKPGECCDLYECKPGTRELCLSSLAPQVLPWPSLASLFMQRGAFPAGVHCSLTPVLSETQRDHPLVWEHLQGVRGFLFPSPPHPVGQQTFDGGDVVFGIVATCFIFPVKASTLICRFMTLRNYVFKKVIMHKIILGKYCISVPTIL